MNIKYHGPSGEFQSQWPEGTPVGSGTEAEVNGVHYVYAGFQDAAHHYREVPAL